MNQTKNVPAIAPAVGTADIDAARALFAEYANFLAEDHGISLEFQGIEEELATLPGKYAPPRGALFLAKLDGTAVGTIAIRPFDTTTCEVKRLYVQPAARGQGLGHRLTAEILATARALGYTRAILDTGGFLIAAQRLYEDFGFTDIPAYYHNPIEGVRYMGCDL